MSFCSINWPERVLGPRDTLSPTELPHLWRVESGALRIDSTDAHGASSFVKMALPGDLIGVERLVGVTDHFDVQALTTSRLLPLSLFNEADLKQLLVESVAKGYQRSRELATLRTGSTEARVQRLLVMLAHNKDGQHTAATTCALPSLGDMATIVSAARESVCRALANLRQINFLQECNPTLSKHRRLKLREHRLQANTYLEFPRIATSVALE
jgi:CRP-like cAMP-binding protein